MQIKLLPFPTPSYAFEADINAIDALPLCHIDAKTLSRMCDDFRAEVFRKAGKADPTPKGTR